MSTKTRTPNLPLASRWKPVPAKRGSYIDTATGVIVTPGQGQSVAVSLAGAPELSRVFMDVRDLIERQTCGVADPPVIVAGAAAFFAWRDAAYLAAPAHVSRKRPRS